MNFTRVVSSALFLLNLFAPSLCSSLIINDGGFDGYDYVDKLYDPFQMVQEKKVKLLHEFKPFKENEFVDGAAVISAAVRVVDASVSYAMTNQCLVDLTTSQYASKMNDISAELGYPIGTTTINDNPIWTNLLLLSILSLQDVKSQVGSVSPIPFSKCTTDEKNKLRCDASILPYLLTIQKPSDPTAYTKYYSEIPKDYCYDLGGTIVHSSFKTDCLSRYNLIPEQELEIFAIPQCIPATCTKELAVAYWAEQIQKDFKEFKQILINDGYTIPQNDACSVKFKLDTSASFKGPKSPKSPKSTKAPKASSKGSKGHKSSKSSKSSKSRRGRKFLRTG
jgi:hypothetical protein